MKYIVIMVLLSLILISCGGTTFVNTATLPDTYQCSYMKDICKEARDFETSYNRKSSEEKKEMKDVMRAYRLQCSEAIEVCKKSTPATGTQKD